MSTIKTKCIYCKKIKPTTSFNDEHVIPRFLGRFEPENPKLKRIYGLVCSKCNSKIFSALETIFKEDSGEGLLAQQLNLNGSNSVRILGKRLKIESVPGFGNSFFNGMFPFMKIEEGKIVIDLERPHVKVKNYANGYQVFPIEALEAAKNNGGSNFKKIKERLSNVKESDISVFTVGSSLENNDLNKILRLLNDFGVKYNEKERKFEPPDKLQGRQWEIALQGTVDRDIGRVLAKIMFNYFTYCAQQERRSSMVYGNEFKKIRDFICGDVSIPLKDVITSIDKDCILDIENEEKKRLILHSIVFEIKDEKIVGRLALFGQRVYEIVIGDIPKFLDKNNFGCGHVFDPFEHAIFNLSQKLKENLTEEDTRVSFGLNRKVGI